MKKLGALLVGTAEHFPFEQRMFNFIILLGIFMTIFGMVMDIHYGGSILIDLVFVGCWLLTYYLSRMRGHFKAVSVVSFCVFVLVFFPYNWISSGGIAGSLPYYAIMFIAVVSIILSGRFRIMMVLSMLAVELILIWMDVGNVDMVRIAAYKSTNRFDLAIHLGVIMIGMAGLIIVYSNTYMKEKARREKYARAIKENYQQQLYYMENLEQLIYRLKAERHDFNHHLGVIYGLLENQDIDKAGNYVKKLVNTAQEYQNIVNIPYSIVRAMLNYKLSSAKEANIPLKLNLNIPGELKLNEYDLTVILGNLLDNAMEACAALEENNRYIDLSILYKPDYLVVRIENPVKGELPFPRGKNRTTKKEPDNHGFGLENIEYLVNKHHGFIKIEPGEDVFQVNIALLAEQS